MFPSRQKTPQQRVCAALLHLDSTSMDPPLLPLKFCPFSSWCLWLLRLLASWFLWPGMNKDVSLLVAWIARRQRWGDMFALWFIASVCHFTVSLTSTSTCWAPAGGLQLHSHLHHIFVLACHLPCLRYFCQHLHCHPCRGDLWLLTPAPSLCHRPGLPFVDPLASSTF